MRLINADALKELFAQNDDLFMSQDIRHVIEYGVPTVDAVQHGHWICGELFGPPTCSVCQKKPRTPGYCGTETFYNTEFAFCPHCGAKMDEEAQS